MPHAFRFSAQVLIAMLIALVMAPIVGIKLLIEGFWELPLALKPVAVAYVAAFFV